MGSTTTIVSSPVTLLSAFSAVADHSTVSTVPGGSSTSSGTASSDSGVLGCRWIGSYSISTDPVSWL